jgi:hypothetical protein
MDILTFRALHSFSRAPSGKLPPLRKMLFKSITLGTLISAAVAQSPAYGQCGGQGWSGSSSCVSGYTCKAQSQYYSQCLPGSGKFFFFFQSTTRTPLISRQVAATRQPQREPPPLHQLLPPTPAVHHPAATEKATRHPSRNMARPILGAAATARPNQRHAVSTRKVTTPPSHRTSSASVRYSSLQTHQYHKHDTNKPSTGRRRRSRLRYMLEAHDPERQLRPPGQQRGQQHRCHGHKPVPGTRQPALLAIWPLGHEPVWREPQLRSLY